MFRCCCNRKKDDDLKKSFQEKSFEREEENGRLVENNVDLGPQQTPPEERLEIEVDTIHNDEWFGLEELEGGGEIRRSKLLEEQRMNEFGGSLMNSSNTKTVAAEKLASTQAVLYDVNEKLKRIAERRSAMQQAAALAAKNNSNNNKNNNIINIPASSSLSGISPRLELTPRIAAAVSSSGAPLSARSSSSSQNNNNNNRLRNSAGSHNSGYLSARATPRNPMHPVYQFEESLRGIVDALFVFCSTDEWTNAMHTGQLLPSPPSQETAAAVQAAVASLAITTSGSSTTGSGGYTSARRPDSARTTTSAFSASSSTASTSTTFVVCLPFTRAAVHAHSLVTTRKADEMENMVVIEIDSRMVKVPLRFSRSSNGEPLALLQGSVNPSAVVAVHALPNFAKLTAAAIASD